MQYYYGDGNLLRALDEAEFWKHQEIEHTQVVKMTTPGLEANFVKLLDEYKEAASKAHGYLVKYVESAVRSGGNLTNEIKAEAEKLIVNCVRQSEKFVAILTEILNKSTAAKGSAASQTVINHIIREAQYFIGIDQLFTKQ